MNSGIPNIRHLAAFAATVRHGSVTRAADVVALTQPAITQAIARLERSLDCRLFEREPGGMRPTEPALLLAPRAEAALALIGSSRVTTTQMRAFLALARHGSYPDAARQTGISAASLHRAVGDLSLALAERLVERRGRHIALTDRGRMRARRFGLARAELHSGLADIHAWLGRSGGRIVIGAMPLSRACWLPRAIVAFAAVHPDVEIAVIEGSHAELVGPLRDGEVDFLLGAIRAEEEPDDLAEERVFVDRPQIVMRAGHPLAHAPPLSVGDLRRFAWVLPGPDTPLREYWTGMMTSDGESAPHVGIECGSVLTIREILLETDCLSLVSPAQLRVEIDAGLHVAKAPAQVIERTIGITTRRDWHPSVAQREMIAVLREIGSKI